MSNLDQFEGAELTVAELDMVAGGGRPAATGPKYVLSPNVNVVLNNNTQWGKNNTNGQNTTIINNSPNSGNVIYLPWY